MVEDIILLIILQSVGMQIFSKMLTLNIPWQVVCLWLFWFAILLT